MKCEACQSVLEEYFDGELAVRRAAEISAHLAGCAACAAEFAELQQEHEIYTTYERGIEVTPDLWAGIAARIKTEKAAMPEASSILIWRARFARLFAAPHISPAFAAAMVILAIGITVVVMSYLQSRNANNNGNVTVATEHPNNTGDSNNNGAVSPAPKPGVEGSKDNLATVPNDEKKSNEPPVKEPKPTPQKQVVAVSHKPQAPPDPMKLVREAEQKYLAAIAILSQDVSRHRSQIDPSVLARFDSALADIDRTIQETRQIVRRHPDDPVALQYLLGAYAKKVDTLRAMSLD
jgi:anti-sigma factor RsiW